MFRIIVSLAPLFIGIGTMVYASIPGGIDFSMMTKEYRVPDFKSAGEALVFANNIKGSKEIEDALIKKMGRMFSESGSISRTTPFVEQKLRWYKDQLRWTGIAASTIHNYIEHGVPADMAQVGSSFYTGEMPIKINRGGLNARFKRSRYID